MTPSSTSFTSLLIIFFQAEDGIRDLTVTGVQTCALPISDATLRPPRPPRGLILSTGEDVPRGQSLRARIFALEVSPGAVNPKRLTLRQRDAEIGRASV